MFWGFIIGWTIVWAVMLGAKTRYLEQHHLPEDLDLGEDFCGFYFKWPKFLGYVLVKEVFKKV